MCSPPVASKHNTVVLLNRALLQWWRYVFFLSLVYLTIHVHGWYVHGWLTHGDRSNIIRRAIGLGREVE